MRWTWMLAALAVVMCGLGVTSATADETLAGLTDQVREVLTSEDPAAAAAPVAWRMAAEKRTPGQLESILMTARQTAGWEASDGESARLKRFKITMGEREHTVYVQLPSTYTPERAWPVLLWLHGAVSREPDEGGLSGIRNLGADAEEEGYILIAPSGRRGAVWWEPAGMELIERSLRELCRNAHVDARRIAAAGFSDGASGCWHLLAHAPDRFCCFIPLHGHPGLTRNLYGPCFKSNVNSRPVYATNGEVDQLYPSKEIQPLVEQLKAAGANITWKDIAGSGHSMAGMASYWQEAKAFWKKNVLPENPRQVTFEARREGARRGWIEIASIDAARGGSAVLGGHVAPLPQRRLLGVQIDRAFEGPGLRISLVTEDSAAAEAGIEAGDVLTSVDGEALEGQAAGNVLRERIQAWKPGGKALMLEVERGEETLELPTRPRIDPLPGYEDTVARVEANWEGSNRISIRTKSVGALQLHIDPLLMKARAPLRIEINGKAVYTGVPTFQPATRLVAAAHGGDGAPAYMATLRLEVPAQDKSDK